jgi:DNA-binding Lrp family transcriptional regulator
MNKFLIITLSAIGILGTTLLLTSPASADISNNGRGRQGALEAKAGTLGISADELENRLGEMTFAEIAEERGLSLNEWHQKLKEKAQERWAEMGFSDEEIGERIQRMEERHAECDGEGSMSRFGGRGFGKNR